MGPIHGLVWRRRAPTFLLLLLLGGSARWKLTCACADRLAFHQLSSPRRSVTHEVSVSSWGCNSNDRGGTGRCRKLSAFLTTSSLARTLKGSTDSSPESELVLDDDDDDDEEGEWLPDRVKARLKRDQARIRIERPSPARFAREHAQEAERFPRSDEDLPGRGISSPYTEEEEDVIAAMGGKARSRSQREEGYLGDSTLQEIAQDYSIPISYIADVLCVWGVPPPIHIYDRLGDLVTGEQAFSLLEAVNSLDVAAVQDRYSNQNLLSLCDEWGIDLQAAFELCMKEGWSLPFGVQTCLRVEQEEELLRVHGSPHR